MNTPRQRPQVFVKAYSPAQIMSIYRSGKIPLDGRKVDAMVRWLQQGKKLPPIKRDKTGRVIDGMHRTAAREEFERIRHNPHTTPPYLYHATSADRMSSIRSKGLLPSEETHWGGDLGVASEGKVFAADTIEKALYYAAIVFRNTLEQDGVAHVPVILKIRTAGQKWTYGEREFWTEKKVVPARLSVLWHGCWHPVLQAKYIDEDMYYRWNEEVGQYESWDGDPVGEKATDAVEDVKLFYLK